MRTEMTPHARRQCETRDFPVEAVQRVVETKLAQLSRAYESVAVFVGRTADRGGLVGSNGECVWAIVRDGVVTTVMLRRGSQPSTPQALRVSAVIGEQHYRAAA
jgi:hypothetical protein